MDSSHCKTEAGRRMIEIYRDMDGRFPNSEPEHFWTLPEVITETEKLANQLVEVKS